MSTHSNQATGRTSSTVLVTVLCMSGTVVALQQTLIIPLLADFPGILGIDYASASWLVTATLLTAAVATPIVSRLADMFGKRRMMVVSLLTMVLGSVIAAVGATFPAMLVGRGLQGFASALVPVGIGILRDELPKSKVAGATAMMSATLGIGSALGLPLSGLVYEHFGWEAIFWLSAAVGVALLVAVLAVVPESPVRTPGRFDYGGAVLLSVALTALLLAISKGGTWGWGSEPTILALVVSLVAFAAWFPYELRVNQPMVDLRTSVRRPVLLTNISALLVGISMYSNMLSTTQQLEVSTVTGYGHGLSVLVAGLCMMPAGLMMVVVAPIAGRLIGRVGAKRTLVAGALVLAGAFTLRIFLTGSVPMIVAGAMLVTTGTAMAYAAMPMLIMGSVPITETASANGLNALLRSVGTSVSSAVISAVLTAITVEVAGQVFPALGAFKVVFAMAAVAGAVAALVAAFIPRQQSAPVVAPIPADAVGAPEELVVTGSVLHADLQPIRHAVVSVFRTSGEPVDWSRADKAGEFSVVLPAPGPYLVVASADGWAPRSQVLEFDESRTRQSVVLAERLRLRGRVSAGGMPATAAVVTLAKTTGEFVASTRCGDDGRYQLALPPTGRYLFTALEPGSRCTSTRQIFVLAQSATIDVDLAEDLEAVRAP
ncbi:MFS transporter [Rhodococcus tukisamuensis]|uniref:Carboxypeptidase regulatory-like domain-containing protein n=1 Tax=Rhodococcus tukisamuensis TaxID=168276 RepID=A0A1G6QLD3_9NOCA|nr:MFS transporter [Rhodococcus tukisamuensis]SDC93113.1 Carboxypeptidase regulatory-like domain-containing protein [Rhodococcus tukisamuensis]